MNRSRYIRQMCGTTDQEPGFPSDDEDILDAGEDSQVTEVLRQSQVLWLAFHLRQPAPQQTPHRQ